MAGPAFQVVGTRAQSAGATSIAPSKPTVGGINGVLIAEVQSKNNAIHSCSTAGWSKLGQQNSGASFTSSIWIAAEGAAAPTFTWTGSAACAAQVVYYADPNGTVVTTVSQSTVSSGSTSTHTSTAFTSDADDALAVYIDAAAANTDLGVPAGWTENSDVGSATDVGRTTFGSKALGTSGTSSGAISVTGANAAWVQWQIQLKNPAASGLDSSKIESAAWLDPPAGLDSSKIESAAWLDPPAGLDSSKIEIIAWLEPGALPPETSDSGYVSILW